MKALHSPEARAAFVHVSGSTSVAPPSLLRLDHPQGLKTKFQVNPDLPVLYVWNQAPRQANISGNDRPRFQIYGELEDEGKLFNANPVRILDLKILMANAWLNTNISLHIHRVAWILSNTLCHIFIMTSSQVSSSSFFNFRTYTDWYSVVLNLGNLLGKHPPSKQK